MIDSGFDITEEETSLRIIQQAGFTVSGMTIIPPQYQYGAKVSDEALDHLGALMWEMGYKLVNKGTL